MYFGIKFIFMTAVSLPLLACQSTIATPQFATPVEARNATEATMPVKWSGRVQKRAFTPDELIGAQQVDIQSLLDQFWAVNPEATIMPLRVKYSSGLNLAYDFFDDGRVQYNGIFRSASVLDIVTKIKSITGNEVCAAPVQYSSDYTWAGACVRVYQLRDGRLTAQHTHAEGVQAIYEVRDIPGLNLQDLYGTSLK